MEIILNKKLQDAIGVLDGKMPIETWPVALTMGELQLLLRSVQLVEAVRDIIPKR